jgi:hypothetical protein
LDEKNAAVRQKILKILINLHNEHPINTIKKNTETLIESSEEVDLEVNTEKTKLLSLHQNSGKNRDINIAERCFEKEAQFRYLGTTITKQNLIREKIKETEFR